MKGGTLVMIGPGNSAASRLYLKLLDDRYGLQMPLDRPLKPEQINLIKAWIDQGAVWPDDVFGETPLPPPDPTATRMMEALRKAPSRIELRALVCGSYLFSFFRDLALKLSRVEEVRVVRWVVAQQDWERALIAPTLGKRSPMVQMTIEIPEEALAALRKGPPRVRTRAATGRGGEVV